MRRILLVPGALLLVAGCSPAQARARPVVAIGSAAPVVPDPPFAGAPVAKPSTPLSLNRLLTESQSEMNDMTVLTKPLRDPKGQARAAAEVDTLADELRGVEQALRESNADSERLDAIATQLQALQTRIALLHDRLRVAALPSTAVQND